jgi:hypothetical protein
MENSYTFSIVNTGKGVTEYHPVSGNSATDVKYKLAIEFRDIPMERLTDSTLWYFLFRLQV